MPQITAIEPQKNKANRFNVYIDGEFGFALSAEALAKADLSIGENLTQQDIDRLIIENEVGKLYDKALRFLSFRPRSEKEVKEFLVKKQTGDKTCGFVLEKLKKLNFLNDAEFAKWFCAQRQNFSPRGQRLITMELVKKGVDREIIDNVFSKNEDAPSEEELAQKSLEKKLKAWGKLPREEFFKKAVNFLQRRGFSWSVSKSVIDKFLKKE